MLDPKIIICIPARHGSTRFPGKVLAMLKNKPVIQWVYEKACGSKADEVIIATDSNAVMEAAEKFGASCVMTSEEHPSGTDRIWEAVKNMDCDVIINVQGDEPMIDVSIINSLIDMFRSDEKIEMGTVVTESDRNVIAGDPNVVKAVLAADNSALYFSRSEIPYSRDRDSDLPIYKHLGIYGYKKSTLKKLVSLPQSTLEQIEKLEQLRALENGIKIFAVITETDNGIGIDTPEDLKNAEKLLV